MSKRLLLIIPLFLFGLTAVMAEPTDEEKRIAIKALFDRTDAVKASQLCDSVASLRTSRPIWHENSTILGTGTLLADNALMNYGDDSYFLNLRYLTNRRALVGENCMVNKLITVVGAGNWNKDMNNLTDEDVNNYAQFNRVVSAGVTVDPVVAIRDMENYYSAGMRAGFCIIASSGSSVLTLDAIKAYSIGFYRDGSLVGTKAVAEGSSIEGVQLSLIQIPGSEDATIVLTATSDWLFDEIQLDRSGGVQVGVGDLLKVKYAFVGNDKEFPITRLNDGTGKPKEGGLYQYSQYTGRDIRLDYAKGWTPVLGVPAPLIDASVEKLVDIDMDNQVSLPTVLAVGYQGGAKFMVVDNDDTAAEVFEAGTEVGFHYQMSSALALSAGAWIRMILYDRDGNRVQEETINSTGLGLSLVNGNGGSAAITSQVPFSGAEIRFHTVLSLDVGGVGINYGYVRLKPDTSHRCQINPTMGTDLCDSQSTLQLTANPDVSVSWTLVSAPAGSAVEVTESGYVSHIDEEGDYVFRATTLDGCYEDMTFHHGITGSESADDCSEKLVNTVSAPDRYELSTTIYGTSGSLLSLSDLDGAENVLSPDLSTFAEYTGGGKLASNLRIVGVKRRDGNLMFDGETNEAAGKKGIRIGFVVESSSTVLNLDLLQLLQIRCYNSSAQEEVYRHLITENNGISLGLIGSEKTTKMRYTIVVPNKDDDGNYIKFDEFMLWTSGVIDIGASHLRIYNAFIEDEDADCGYPLNCSATLLSNRETHTTLNSDETKFGGVVSVASVVNNLSFLVDDDPESYVTVLKSVSLGDGLTIAVNTGRTLDYHHQLGIIIDNKTYAASVGAGSWMTVKTFYHGVETGDSFSDWSVLGADVAGYGDKSYLYMQPTKPFDEVRITLAQVLGALDATNIYGLFVRNDVDNDGIPDCQDPESCHSTINDISITSVCVGDEIVVTGIGTISTDYKVKFSDSSASTAVGYNVGDGMVHTTSDPSGNIEIRYTTTGAGYFQMVFYDASDTPLTSVFYSVHPTRSTWKTSATNNDWNKWDNWSDGTPYCCTDVIIPKGAKYYPELDGAVTNGDEFCCQSIHFEPGAAVGAVTNLNYAQAWVETEMEPNRYHLLSAPLKHMYTGDMFVPASMNGVHQNVVDYFEKLDEATSPENRFNPTIYQRRWYATSTGRNVDGYEVLTGLEDEATKVSELSLTKWSRNFNLLNFPYALGQGISVWVDNGNLSDELLFRFRFPKTQTTYNYFYDFNQQRVDGVSETLERSSDANLKGERFIYEEDDAGNTPFHFVTDNVEYKRFENRVVYNADAVFPSSVTLTAEASSSHFLFGNPFMSRLDVEKFLIANEPVVRSVKFYDGNTLKTATVSGGVVTGTTNVTFIAPMQSVLLEAQSHDTSINVTLNKDMLVGQHGEAKGWPARLAALRIGVNLGSNTADLMLVEGQEMSSTMLFDNEVKPQIAIFGVDENGEAFDIMPANHNVPLGLYLSSPDTLSFTFRTQGQFAREIYVLYDRQTDTEYALEDLRLPVEASSTGRFYICEKGWRGESGLDRLSSNPVVSVKGRCVQVSCYTGICEVEAFDLTGRMLKHIDGKPERIVTLELPAGVVILVVKTGCGNTRSFKLLVH